MEYILYSCLSKKKLQVHPLAFARRPRAPVLRSPAKGGAEGGAARGASLFTVILSVRDIFFRVFVLSPAL